MTLADDFALAVHRQSAMLLDNIGIRVRFADLPSAASYREAKRAYYAGPWWWHHYLRRWLRPGRHRQLRAEFDHWQHVTQQELMSEVLRQGEELLQ